MEKLVEDISFTASERPGEKILITAEDVRQRVGILARNSDVRKYVL
jgi:ATP-dependent HslUV protease ATP-binding subunit HslU